MNVEQRPDGWHITSDSGEHFGPISSLMELEELLDHLENAQRTKTPQPAAPPAKEPAIRPKLSPG
jgi:hypothetical protein